MRWRNVSVGWAWCCLSLLSMGTDVGLWGIATACGDETVAFREIENCPTCFVADGCSECTCEPQRFLGMLSSDHCFDDFISPVSNPFFFEDPRSLTEARGIYLENHTPAAIGDAEVSVWAGQFRGRLTDRWSVIAPRLAYLDSNQSGGAESTGFMTAPLGLKYNFIRDIESQFLASAGITYFIPSEELAIGNPGDGDMHFFVTAGKRFWGAGHWLSATGFRIPLDSNWGSQLWYWSNQWDYKLPGNIYPLVGLNWFHWMRSAGNNFTGAIGGLDMINLPAGNVAGDNVVTAVAGAKWKPSGHWEFGFGYEFAMTARTDILYDRVYADVILRY